MGLCDGIAEGEMMYPTPANDPEYRGAFVLIGQQRVQGLPWFRAEEEIVYMLANPRHTHWYKWAHSFTMLAEQAKKAGDAFVKMGLAWNSLKKSKKR